MAPSLVCFMFNFKKMKLNGQVGMWAKPRRFPQLSTTMRYWEYYNMQETFDRLYEESQGNKSFHGLYELITSENNILLAYRTIKSNKGSKTAGTDLFTIDNYKPMYKRNSYHWFVNN